ncbi:hypothetical protein L915_12289 [Phytophthora nicotianae]|uniref:Uncharacterized protein n=1 Tax=Phytophthora nicotianae TaxID=4792 RepID=W2GH15_PHYNI|nr:hypothetical protein L915_12289 [Phytophthora nicotianae]
MATHNNKKCRRCSCRSKACQRRRVEQRRQGKSLISHAQFLLIPCPGASTRKHQMDTDEELQPDEIAINSEDLQVMSESVSKMQQQISRGLRDIQEIRALVKKAVAQRELEQREIAMRRVKTESKVTRR